MTARELAFELLSRWSPRSEPITRELDRRLDAVQLPANERGLAAELVQGIVRRKETLDSLLRHFVSRPLNQVEPGAVTLLQLGVYQLVFLSGIPAYAVVHETAELAKRRGKPQWTGFINGVLRAVSRCVSDEFVAEPAVNAVPLADGRYRRLTDDVFPDPGQKPLEYFSSAFGFPLWLAERWTARWTGAELLRIGFWFNTPPKLCLRVNTLKTTREAFLAALRGTGIPAHAGDHPDAVWLDGSRHVPELPGFAEGHFAVQDESAMTAAMLLAPRPGERVLDLCAAPGGKTTHLAALMQNSGSIVAADVDGERLKLVDDSCRRLGITIAETRQINRDSLDLPVEPFDAILMDVPCSNTGVLGKRPEVRHRLSPSDIAELAVIQLRLLKAALSRLGPKGRLVYSTCSIEPEENRGVVDAGLKQVGGFQIAREVQHVPGKPADGGYAVLLKRE